VTAAGRNTGAAGPPPAGAAAAWVLLDWAASAFSTVQITLLFLYLDAFVFAGDAWGFAPRVVREWTLAVAMLAAAVAAPVVAARADRLHRHRGGLVGSVLAGAGALAALAIVPPTARLAVAAALVVANVAFDLAAMFTGSLLARLATGRQADRLSAAGFAAGYLGGALALLAALAVARAHERLGLTPAGGLRAAFLLTGGWWLAFSLPAAWARFGDGAGERHAGTSVRELLDFLRGLARGDAGREVAATLAGAALVLGGVQTAIPEFSSVAREAFALGKEALVGLVLLVQFVALPGAVLVGWISARAGRRVALGLCLAGWVAVLGLAWFVRTPAQLHALAVLLALVLGGVQSVIRATVADVAPPGRSAATFGVLQVTTKLAGAAAFLVLGVVNAASGDPRLALATLLVPLVAGWWVLRGHAAGAGEGPADQ
jgi:UMF1 family MFS transporter